MLAEKHFQRNRLAIYLIEKQGTIYVQASQFDNLKEEVKSIWDNNPYLHANKLFIKLVTDTKASTKK
jgi:hypothetical protein